MKNNGILEFMEIFLTKLFIEFGYPMSKSQNYHLSSTAVCEKMAKVP